MADFTLSCVLAAAMFGSETSARCTLERLAKAGYVIVPRELTGAMMLAGANAAQITMRDAEACWRGAVTEAPS